MLLGGLLGDEQLNDGAVARQSLTDGLRTLDEELPCGLAITTLEQLRGVLDPLRLR